MRVMVTGGTGFAGSHTVRRLLAHGHSVRLLVRSREKVRRIFDPLDIGFPEEDVIEGDIVDADSVDRAMAGCDAVYHGAALVEMKRSMAQKVLATNARGVELVVGGAAKRGLPSIVYCSSSSIFFRPGVDPVTTEHPIPPATTAYAKSKAESEVFVRELQEQGAPIRTSYPSGIIGPDDPGLSEANHAVYIFFKLTGITMPSGFQIIDVRDLAEIHTLLIEHPEGSYRAMAGGPFLSWHETYSLLDDITGTRLWRFPCPAPLMRLAGSVGDQIKKVWDFEFPLTRDGMEFATGWPGTAPDPDTEALGVDFRTARTTYRDTVRWMNRAGHLPDRLVGKLAHDDSAEDADADVKSA